MPENMEPANMILENTELDCPQKDLDPTPTYSQLTLETADKELINVDREVIKMSNTIRTMLSDLGLDDETKPVETIPLHNISAAIMKKIIVYCEKHKGEKYVEKEDDYCDNMEDWDKEYIEEVDNKTLYDLIMASSYLDVKGLLNLGCKAVANMIKGKSPDEIRATFNIVNDLTKEEEDQIRKENYWCEEDDGTKNKKKKRDDEE